ERRQRVLFGAQRRRGHEGTAADLTAQVALVDQALVRAGYGLRGHIQPGCKAAYGRQALAWPERTGLDAATELVDQLLAQRGAAASGTVEGQFKAVRARIVRVRAAYDRTLRG